MNQHLNDAASTPKAPPPTVTQGEGLGFSLQALLASAMNKDASVADLPGLFANALPPMESLPALGEGLELYMDQLIALQPVDFEYTLNEVALRPDTGKLEKRFHGNTGGPLEERTSASYTPTALSQLLSFTDLDRGLARCHTANLLWYPPSIRAAMFDRTMFENRQADENAKRMNRKVTFRLVHAREGHAILRAVTSDTHTLDNGDSKAVCQRLMKRVGEAGHGARLKAHWGWDTSSFIVFFGSDESGVRAVARLSLSETKAHSWYTVGGAHIGGRTYWGWQQGTASKGRHVGEQVANKMVEQVFETKEQCEQIQAALATASKMEINAVDVEELRDMYQLAPELAPLLSLDEQGTIDVPRTVRAFIDRVIDIVNGPRASTLQGAPAEERATTFGALGQLLQDLFEQNDRLNRFGLAAVAGVRS